MTYPRSFKDLIVSLHKEATTHGVFFFAVVFLPAQLSRTILGYQFLIVWFHSINIWHSIRLGVKVKFATNM